MKPGDAIQQYGPTILGKWIDDVVVSVDEVERYVDGYCTHGTNKLRLRLALARMRRCLESAPGTNASPWRREIEARVEVIQIKLTLLSAAGQFED